MGSVWRVETWRAVGRGSRWGLLGSVATCDELPLRGFPCRWFDILGGVWHGASKFQSAQT